MSLDSPDHYRWFEERSAADFYLLGRFIMRHRKEFAELTLGMLKAWSGSKALAGGDERARIVYGASYAVFCAMANLLESHEKGELEEFKAFLVRHLDEAVREVQSKVMVNEFWTDLLSAMRNDAFGETPSDRRRLFKVVECREGKRPWLTAKQIQMGRESARYAWKSYVLYFTPDAVLDLLRKYKRSQGRELLLEKSDLRAQMKVQPYWVQGKQDGHVQRFAGESSTQRCWCIAFDHHELGYRAVSDGEFQQSLYVEGNTEQGNFLPVDEWMDPRKGDLFAIVDALRGEGDDE